MIDEYAGNTISVGDLRKALEGVDNAMPVYVDVSDLIENTKYEGYMGNVRSAAAWSASGINNRCLVIELHGEKWGF